MYDVFSPKPGNSAPINVVPAQVNLLARNTPYSPDAKLSDSLPLHKTDNGSAANAGHDRLAIRLRRKQHPAGARTNAAAGDQ